MRCVVSASDSLQRVREKLQRGRAVRAGAAASPDPRIDRSHRDQYADFRLRDVAADLLRSAGHDIDEVVYLYLDHVVRGADRMCTRCVPG